MVDQNGYDPEENATCCLGCRFYIEHEDDYAECGAGAGDPFGEWVPGRCATRALDEQAPPDTAPRNGDNGKEVG